MKKYFTLCIAAVFICGLFAGFAAALEQKTPYENWSQFKPGTFVTYKVSSDTAGIKTETQMTLTLKEVTDSKIVLETSTVTEAFGMKVETPGEAVEISKDDESMPSGVTGLDVTVSGADSVQTVEEKTEKMTVKDQEFEVTKIIVKTQDAGQDVTVTYWHSNDFPGQNLKSITEVGGFAPVKTEMVVIDFKVVQ